MAQTDRQTDKAIHWKTAVFDDPNGSTAGNWEALDKLPDHVKELHRKKEICPETQREHFQIHVVCHRQVRLKAMTDWIKHTKWFAVLGKQHIENSLAYIRKVETTAPGAEVEVLQGDRYLQIHELLLFVARNFEMSAWAENDMTVVKSEWIATKQYLWKYASPPTVSEYGLKWISKLSNPVLEKSWNIYYAELLKVVWEEEGSFIIEDPVEGQPKAGTELAGFEECLIT